MKKKLGFVLKSIKYHIVVLVPTNYVSFKYKKIQIRVKKYHILNYRQEYKKGDIVLLDPNKNKIYTFYK